MPGKSDAPKLLNRIMGVAIVWFHDHSQENQWGHPIKKGTSDNILFRLGIFGSCRICLLTRTQCGATRNHDHNVENRLATVGWDCWGTALEDSSEVSINIDGMW